MRAVNLLPSVDRAQVVKAAPAGASKAVLGGLAVLVLAMLIMVFSQNQITDRKNEVAKLNAEAQTAQQQSSSLGSFGQFAQIKETRVKSIGDLAKTRFDWERLMRELALVLPKGTWLSTVNATATGTTDEAGGTSPTSPPTETMVRLRNLYRADDVTLAESTGPSEGGATASASAGASAGDGAPNSCGDNYQFTATVSFATDSAREAAGGKGVPTRLGGES